MRKSNKNSSQTQNETDTRPWYRWSKFPPLSVTHPEVAGQWHPTKNGNATPDEYTYASNIHAWWLCPVASDHVWRAVISNRTYHSSGCPFCAGLRVSKENSLATRCPESKAYWHPTKNKGLRPAEVSYVSKEIVWWKCPAGSDHEWQKAIVHFFQYQSAHGIPGCPACARKSTTCTVKTERATGTERQIPEIEEVVEAFCGKRRKNVVRVIDKRPELADEWCYAKNCGWGPEDFSYGSDVKAWWTCPDCHRDYKTRISIRTASKAHGCPFCTHKKVTDENALLNRFPDIAAEWHPTKNAPLMLEQIMQASGKLVWWQCSFCEHTYQAAVNARTACNAGCPLCREAYVELKRSDPPPRVRGHVVLGPDADVSRAWYEAGRINFTPLSQSHPAIAAQWDFEKNGDWTPDDFAHGSEAIAWWRCPVAPDHSWQANISSRTATDRKGKCPFCLGRKQSSTNSLLTQSPQIAAEWHPTKNLPLSVEDMKTGSTVRAWWQCTGATPHEWQARVCDRTKANSGCAKCLRAANNLALKYPEVAAEWHPTKNGNLTPDQIAPASGQKFFWKCARQPKHIWEAVVSNRTKLGSGCPTCASH